MSSLAPGERLRLKLHQAGRLGRKLRLRPVLQVLLHWRDLGAGGSELVIAPPDLRTADPTIAMDIYAGHFVFAGQAVEAAGRSPFDLPPPSPDWARSLHGFGWLRHLRAAETALAHSNGRAIVADWLKSQARGSGIAWEPQVAARRTLAFLAQSGLILDDADHDFYRRFVRVLLGHARFLRTRLHTLDAGIPRLRAIVAIAMVGLSLSRQERLARTWLERLDEELEVQVLPDGGHASRNPAALVEALLDLLPLRQALVARGMEPSAVLVRSIERMMPMLRFFRHGDGAFAHFNGVSSSAADRVATVLAYDEALGTPVSTAAYSGYERVEAGPSLLIVDAGPPPTMALSQRAHAGTLSFEFSSGAQRIVINCGAPARRHIALCRAARETAAHSTATINDASSSRFSGPEPDAHILSGPRRVDRQRNLEPDGSHRLRLAHDGYARLLGLRHERVLSLAADGLALAGADAFSGRGDPDAHFAVRFHLHPNVKLHHAEDETAFFLALPDGSVWCFEADCPIAVEESVCLSDVSGRRATRQLVLEGMLRDRPSVQWRLTRYQGGGGDARGAAA
jgi:uncharacterized heparinase superfamily protein